MNEALMTVASNWLNSMTGDPPYGSSYNCYLPWITYPSVMVTTTPARPIRLTLKEVDRLRKAAKVDAALRDVLQKFTPQIEVIVDLE